MWIVYKKKDLSIIGMSANCELDIDKELALKEIVSGSRNPGDIEEYDAIQVSDIKVASRYMRAFPDKLLLLETADSGHPKVTIREPEHFSLYVITDAVNKHPVDGIPTIAADGDSSLLITISKIDERGKPQNGENDNDKIFIRTDNGIIRDADGKEEIGNIDLVNGEAKIRLFSEKVKRVATVQIFCTDSNIRGNRIKIDFI